jgi:hypothetical protein
MGNIFDVIYYQAYLFYSKRLKEDDPHLTATWGVGISFAFIVTFPVFTVLQAIYCYEIKTYIMFISAILISSIFFIYYKKDGRNILIVKNKPLFRGNMKMSIFISLIYFGIAISMLFICPIIGSNLKKIYCN